MNLSRYGVVCLVLGLMFVYLALTQSPVSADAATQPAQANDKPVEQVQKNIQVLTGMPSSQLLPVMHFMRTSLGVRCDYCHVAENGKYWMDDKPAKQTARRMLKMVFEINKASFGGQPVVTCNTCHRGATKPVAVPSIGQGSFTNTTSDEAPGTLDPLPTAEQVFDRYQQALGGKAQVDKIKTRWMKITLLRPKLINSGTPKAAVLNRGETWTMESFLKAPDKYLAIVTTPDEVISQGFNGTTGWFKSKKEGQHELNAAEVARMKRQADLYYDLKLKERYSELRMNGKAKIGEQEVYVVEARPLNNKSERLFFAVKSGLLLRRIVFTEIKLGLDPEQTDYEDYRAVDGVWLPFTVRVSYLDDNHFGTTRTLTRVRQNIQIDDSRFEVPR